MCDDFEYYEDDRYDDDNWVVCDECNGDGTVNCYCGGDFCLCGMHDEKPCPVCGGEYGTGGFITKELWENRAKAHRELMEAIWGTK